MCSRLGAALCVGGGTLLLLSMQHYASHHGSRQARPFHGEAHQQVEVDSSLKTLRGLAPTVRGGRAAVKARLVADDCAVPAGAKKLHLIRHGEGVHNVAQREWRSRDDYDGRSEPTVSPLDLAYMSPMSRLWSALYLAYILTAGANRTLWTTIRRAGTNPHPHPNPNRNPNTCLR